MHPVNKANSNPQSLPPSLDLPPSVFSRVCNDFWHATSSLPAERDVAHLKADSPKGSDDKKAMSFEPVIPVAMEALQVRPKPPLFVPYKIKIECRPAGVKTFEVATLEQEEGVMKELTDIVDEALEPLTVYEGLPEGQFASIMEDFRPHHMRVRKVFAEKFAIHSAGLYSEKIGPKIAKKEEREDGITQITYQNGKVKDLLQPYSEARHPWAIQMLEKGMELPPHAIEQLQQAMPKLMKVNKNLNERDPDGIHLFKGANMVFSLDAVPGVVFKRAEWSPVMAKESETGNKNTAERFEKMVKAQFVCRALGLDLLVVPSAKKIEVEYLGQTYLFIAEERLNVDTDRSVQEECYRKYSCEMGELVKQLILFIRHTSMSDISWRNIPLFNDNVAKVGLIDLDRTDTSVRLGLLGTGEDPERGLLNCLFSEEQIDAVVEAMRPYDRDHDADKMKQRRLKELEQEAKWQQFHLEKGLLQEPRRLIAIGSWTAEDYKRLGLDLQETSEFFPRQGAGGNPISKTVPLMQAVLDIVYAINYFIQKAPPQASIKGIRRLSFNINVCKNAELFGVDNKGNRLLSRLAAYGTYTGLHKAKKPSHEMSPEELGEYLWFDRVARALVQAGHLCHFEKKGATYILQA